MQAPDMNDEFLNQIRVRPQPQFANTLKRKLDQSSSDWGYFMFGFIDVSAPISSRSVVLFAIIGLHIAIIFAFANGLARKIPIERVLPITAEFPKVEQAPAEAPAPIKPILKTFAIPVPEPVVPIEYVPDAPAGSEITETFAPVDSGTASSGTSSSFIPAGIGRNFPNPDSYYPPSAIRQEIDGKALVRVCVDPGGRLAEAPQIARSTRYRLLDEAALRLARAGNYVAGSRDGVPVTDCFNFQVVFNLKNGR